MTIVHEPELRKELYSIPPIESLFKLTSCLDKERYEIVNITSVLDYWIIQGNLHIYEKLSKELVKTGKIAPPY